MTGRMTLAILLLVSIPVAALAGAALTRSGRPLAGIVERHYRWLSALSWIGVVAASYLNFRFRTLPAAVVLLAAWWLCAALFMPSLRRLQNRTGMPGRRPS